MREFYPKYWVFLTLENGNKYWKSQGNLAVRKVKTMEIEYHTLNKKNTGKMEKMLEKSGKFVSPKKWKP